MRSIFCLALLILLSSAFATDLTCPIVVDGSIANEDLSTQTSLNEIQANWFGIPRNNVLRYEWAIISDRIASPLIRENKCRTVSGISSLPDIQPWTSTRSTFVSNQQLELELGSTYYVLLRTVLVGGTQVYSNSNGVKIVDVEPFIQSIVQEQQQPVEFQFNDQFYNEFEYQEYLDQQRQRQQDSTKSPKTFLNKLARDITTDSCPIDEQNRCNQALNSKYAVGEFLDSIYGPPIWSQTSPVTLLYRLPTTAAIAAEIGLPSFGTIIPVAGGGAIFVTNSSSSSSDDDDGGGHHLSPGGIVGIAVGSSVGGALLLLAILLLLLLLLLILLILIFVCCIALLKPKKFDENFTVRTQDVVDSDIGTRTDVDMGDSNTRVEFPDLDAPS